MDKIIEYIVSSIGHTRDYLDENQESLDRLDLAYIRGRIDALGEILDLIGKMKKGEE